MLEGTYGPNAVRRVEIPQDGGKKRQLGIPTVVDRLIQPSISQYLISGLMVGSHYESRVQGTVQCGPLSPLLSNIMLHELDIELESRGHKFVRYADDWMIFCKSKRSALRVKESITTFIEQPLFLKVNLSKTSVGSVRGMKFLGYSFYVYKGECRLSVHPKSYLKLKTRLKELTGRSNGMGYDKRKSELRLFIRGWIEYFQLADMQSYLKRIDEWLRPRIRMCIWKCWKKVKRKFVNLQKCGISRFYAWQHANTRLGYWIIAGSRILTSAMNNDKLKLSGYPTLMEYYSKLHRR